MSIDASQLFNADEDESTIFIKFIAFVLWDDREASGRKLNRTRYTLMPSANLDGSRQFKLMFIDKSENP